MDKNWKKRPKNDKNEQNVNNERRDKTNKVEKKVKKEDTKKKEEIKEIEEDKNEKIIEKIHKVKYLSVYAGNEDCDDGVETYRENGEKVGPDEEEPPLNYGNFGFKVDIDTGRILDWLIQSYM